METKVTPVKQPQPHDRPMNNPATSSGITPRRTLPLGQVTWPPVFLALIIVLISLVPLTMSSCGGSLDFKLWPFEYHFKKGSCSAQPDPTKK